MSQTFIKIVKKLPLELQQEILCEVLKETNERNFNIDNKRNNEYSRTRLFPKSHYASLWWNFPEVIKYISSHPKISIDILVDHTFVTFILNPNVKIQILIGSNVLLNSDWIKRISEFKLEILNVRVRVLGNTFGETHKIRLVRLINKLIRKLNPIEFGFNEFTADFSYLLDYKYDWVDKITILQDFPASDIESIYTQIDRFKSLRIIKFKVSWTFFGPVNIDPKLEKFEKLLNIMDKMIFNLGFYDRKLIDYDIEDRFISFFNQHTDKIEFQMDDVSCPFDFRCRRMLKCAHKIKYFTATDSDSISYIGGEGDQDSITALNRLDDFKLLSHFDKIKAMTIDILYLHNVVINSPHIQKLNIICETCENVNLSKLQNLITISITALEYLNTDTVNSIPISATQLAISCNSHDLEKFKVQKYTQYFKTTPDLLFQFDFSSNQHLTKLSLDIHRFDNLDIGNNCWNFIPRTVELLSISYTQGQLNDEDPDATMATTDTMISEEEYKIFGITIPQSITQLSLSLLFKDNYLSPSRVLNNMNEVLEDDEIREAITPVDGGSIYYKVDAIYINSEKQCSSIYEILTRSNKIKRWANIEIGENTKLDLLLTLGNINSDILIVCDDEIVHNVDCYLCNNLFTGNLSNKKQNKANGKLFEKYDGNEGVSYLSYSSNENERIGIFGTCSII